jgi:hypothetical protein
MASFAVFDEAAILMNIAHPRYGVEPRKAPRCAGLVAYRIAA